MEQGMTSAETGGNRVSPHLLFQKSPFYTIYTNFLLKTLEAITYEMPEMLF
jgi:hypothetical protein